MPYSSGRGTFMAPGSREIQTQESELQRPHLWRLRLLVYATQAIPATVAVMYLGGRWIGPVIAAGCLAIRVASGAWEYQAAGTDPQPIARPAGANRFAGELFWYGMGLGLLAITGAWIGPRWEWGGGALWIVTRRGSRSVGPQMAALRYIALLLPLAWYAITRYTVVRGLREISLPGVANVHIANIAAGGPTPDPLSVSGWVYPQFLAPEPEAERQMERPYMGEYSDRIEVAQPDGSIKIARLPAMTQPQWRAFYQHCKAGGSLAWRPVYEACRAHGMTQAMARTLADAIPDACVVTGENNRKTATVAFIDHLRGCAEEGVWGLPGGLPA